MMIIALSVFTGFMVSLMIQLNGILQTAAGAINALLVIHLSGLSGALIFLLFFLRRFPGDKSQKTPVYCLGAGAVGTAIVFLASVTFIKGGILLSLSGSLAGQTLSASVAEQFYGGRRQRSPLVQRILSPLLMIAGSVIIGFKAGVSIWWIIISWSPGIILMLQQSMNAANTLRYGTPFTVLFNYLSALVVIIPLFIIKNLAGPAGLMDAWQGMTAAAAPLSLSVIIGGGLIGVFTTGAIAFMLLKAPALLVILGIYAGELAGGIILDVLYGNTIAVEKIIGLLLIASGLAAGRLKKASAVSEA